jgi:threonine/homoserine/homoserine lactone efflux protein
MRPSQLIALTTFIAVGSGSPGPNNTLLLASGVKFGFRRTVPHVVGTCVGITLLVGLAVAGEGALVTAVPGVKLALKLIASAYLVYLAVRLMGGVALKATSTQKPFSVARAAAFQFVNPKGWVFALALVSAFVTAGGTGIVTRVAPIAIVAVVVGVTATAWALGGTALRRALEGDRARRIAGAVLGALLLASVAFLWL